VPVVYAYPANCSVVILLDLELCLDSPHSLSESNMQEVTVFEELQEPVEVEASAVAEIEKIEKLSFDKPLLGLINSYLN